MGKYELKNKTELNHMQALYEAVLNEGSPKFKDIVLITVDMGEAKFSKFEGNSYLSVEEAEKAFNKIKRPSAGYDKVFLKVKMKDGKQHDVRYYHSVKDGSLSSQFEALMGGSKSKVKDKIVKVTGNPKFKTIDTITVDMGEAKFSNYEGNTYKSVEEAEKAFNLIKKPKAGYDKVFLKIKMKNGKQYDVKYYHMAS